MKIEKYIIVIGLIISGLFTGISVFGCTLDAPNDCDQAELSVLMSDFMARASGGSDSSISNVNPSMDSNFSILGIPLGFRFVNNLAIGSRGSEVLYLQKLLNSDPDTQVAYTGYGSPGWETTYFGYSTKVAVMKFQNKYATEVLFPYRIYKSVGFWGRGSIVKANDLISFRNIDIPVNPTEPSYPNNLVNGDSCLSGSVYSSITGQLCNRNNSTIPGCSQGFIYSPTTGQLCNGGSNNNNPITPVSGVLAVSLSYDNPGSTTLVAGQANADLAHYTFVNGSNTEARITSVELRRLGISGDSVLRNVYLFDGSTRLTDSASVSSGRITFNNSYGVFVVPAGGTKIISVKSDIDTGSSGQTVGISLDAVYSNIQISSSIPLSGSINSIAGGSTLSNVTISNVQPSGSPSADSGSGVRVWEATFNVNNKNVRFTRLALKQINSIDSRDVRNFKLQIDGSEVAYVDSLDSNNYAIFNLDRVLSTGSRNVKVLADISGGSSRYVQMSLRNSADIDIRDYDYNVSVAPTGLPATAGAISINVGQFTVTPQNSYLPTSIARGGSNVLIGKFTVRAVGEPIRVDSLKFGFTSSNASVNSLKNGRVMIAGSQAGSTATILKSGTVYYVNYTFQPGTDTDVEFYADIVEDTYAVSGDTSNDLTANDSLAIQMLTQIGNATRQTSYNVINVPSSTQINSAVLVSQANLTVFKKSNYGDQITVLPKTAFKIGSWNVVSGTAENVNVNNLGFTINSVTGTSFTNANLSDMYVVYSLDNGSSITTNVKNTVNSSNDYSISFNFPTARTMSIDLYANLVGTATIGDSLRAALVISGTGAQSGINMTTATSNGQIISNNNPSLIVSRDASTAISALYDDYGNVKTVAYKFEAQNDSYTITQLSFGITDPSVVSSVILKDGETVLQTVPAANTVTFNNFSNLTVSANSSKTLTVELVLSNVGMGAGNSGANVATSINLASCLVRSSNGGLIVPVGTPSVGNALYVYKAIPIISLAGLPTSTLSTGTQTISKFSISTNGTGTIAWKKMRINIAKTAGAGKVAITNAEVWVDGNTRITGTATITSLGDTDSYGNVIFVADSEQQVSGQRTYEFRATLTATAGVASGDYINSSIPNTITSFVPANTYAIVAATPASFAWSDVSSQGHSETTSDWNSDFLVKNLPTSTQNLTK